MTDSCLTYAPPVGLGLMLLASLLAAAPVTVGVLVVDTCNKLSCCGRWCLAGHTNSVILCSIYV